MLDLFSVFMLHSQSELASVFVSCDISTVTAVPAVGGPHPWFKGAPLLQRDRFVFAQQKNMYHTIFMRCTIT